MPADGEAVGDQHAAARAPLAGGGRRHGDYSLPGACCLESEVAQERRPPRITDTLGEMVVLEQSGRLQVFVVDRVVGTDQRQRCLVVKILPLSLHLLMRLGE
jgi:hypothetical protein